MIYIILYVSKAGSVSDFFLTIAHLSTPTSGEN